ncbi:MAG: methylenetetrahydrofolate reductase [NAD(P)H] [Spirochaetes bacterium]|nr:methylenetetrahydrofolate reductase [NAD(P)H] [Spirochaetota bacterium]
MHIREILAQNKPTFSFEFFPPKTDAGFEKLYSTIKELIPLKPAFVSVTYGAGGSTRQKTHDLVMKLHNETDLTVIPHLTCVGATRDEIKTIITEYHKNGISNILALRGDPPEGYENFIPVKDGFNYASDLVSFIKENFPSMGIGIAAFPEGHPLTPNRLLEMEYLKQKVDAGADYICTQLFFENRDLYDFSDRCKISGIDIPIIAGIMPITTHKGMKRMAELSAGSRFPAPLLRSITEAEDDDSVKSTGVKWAIDQVQDLIEHGVHGVHFYTLNHSEATLNIYQSLKV